MIAGGSVPLNNSRRSPFFELSPYIGTYDNHTSQEACTNQYIYVVVRQIWLNISGQSLGH